MRCIAIVTIVAAACTSLAVAQFETNAAGEKLDLNLEGPPVLAQIKATRPEYFDGCGVLRLGPQTCILIHTDDGRAYAVENTGNFWPGEYVHVSGLIDEDALACWPASIPAIYDNTIGACFAGTGTLGRGPQNCTVIFNADEGQSYVLDDYGDFFWGDRVYVTVPCQRRITGLLAGCHTHHREQHDSGLLRGLRYATTRTARLHREVCCRRRRGPTSSTISAISGGAIASTLPESSTRSRWPAGPSLRPPLNTTRSRAASRATEY